MFTGLVQALGTVRSVEPSAAGRRFLIDPGGWSHRPSAGDSIAVSGCCLTVAESVGEGGFLAFDVVPETLARTTLSGLRPGLQVNLEHSATLQTLLGGHLVQGHVDGVGVIEQVRPNPGYTIAVRPPDSLMEFITPKGSVTLDGVSLTVAGVDPAAGLFEIALIPTTLAATTLGRAAPGTACNIETDILGRTIVHWLRTYGGR